MSTMTTSSSLACPPRFGTPRNPARPTLGKQVGEIARKLGLAPMPWQQHVLDVAFELAIESDDAEPGTIWHGEVDNTVPRQQGKTALTTPVAAHRLTVMARLLGPQRLTYTAQKRASARKKLEQDFAETLRGSRSFKEITNPKARPQRPTEWKLALNNGSEHIRMGNSYWQIDSPTRTGTHGETLDVGQIDEAFAYQTDDVEQAMKPAQATRTSPQLWLYSTAGDARSYYLWRKVLAGRKAHEAGEHGRVAYFEWSAPDEADPGDPETWRLAMPALGFTVAEEFVRSEWERAQRRGPEGVAMFRRAYLNQWPEIPQLDDAIGAAVFGPGVWAAVCAAEVAQPSAGLVLAVDMNPERTRTAVAVAGGGGTAGLIDERPGEAWAFEEVVRIALERDAPVAVAARGPASSLILPLEQAGVKVLAVSSADVATACGWFFAAVVESAEAASSNGPRKVTVKKHPVLDQAVASAAKKPVGDRFVWAGDVCALVALTLATWKAATTPDVDMAGQVW